MKFERFEYKFAVDPTIAMKIRFDLASSMELDTNAKIKSGYSVHSIYFDDIYLNDFRNKQDALLVRGKFRLRSYNQITPLNKNVFLEYKGKYGDFVIKERQIISENILDSLLSGTPLQSYYNNLSENFSFTVLKDLILRPTLKPLSIVTYNRLPLVGKIDNRIRVTFDTDIRSSGYNKNYTNFSLKPMRGGLTVIELKFCKDLPSFLHNVIKKYNLQRLSHSKAEFSFVENGIRYV